jgi:hypothetical protein
MPFQEIEFDEKEFGIDFCAVILNSLGIRARHTYLSHIGKCFKTIQLMKKGHEDSKLTFLIKERRDRAQD